MSADKASADGYKGKVALPLRVDKDSCNFSFSGIKTSVALLVEQEMKRLEGDEQAQAR
jgi:tRNA A37 threonylcarbamoyltransferase TsaD